MLRGLSPRATRANLEAILTELKKRDIPTMLTGMVAAPNMGTDYAAAFNPIYPELAEEFGVPLYPIFLEGVIGNRSLLLLDGMHTNDRGVHGNVRRDSPTLAAGLEGVSCKRNRAAVLTFPSHARRERPTCTRPACSTAPVDANAPRA